MQWLPQQMIRLSVFTLFFFFFTHIKYRKSFFIGFIQAITVLSIVFSCSSRCAGCNIASRLLTRISTSPWSLSLSWCWCYVTNLRCFTHVYIQKPIPSSSHVVLTISPFYSPNNPILPYKPTEGNPTQRQRDPPAYFRKAKACRRVSLVNDKRNDHWLTSYGISIFYTVFLYTP